MIPRGEGFNGRPKETKKRMRMKRFIITTSVIIASFSLHASNSESAMTGTAWGDQSGVPTCAGVGVGRICFLHLHDTYGLAGDLTTVACPYPYDTACSQVPDGSTVIVSVIERYFNTTAYSGHACVPDGNLWNVY